MPKRKNMGPSNSVDPFNNINLAVSTPNELEFSFARPMDFSSLPFAVEDEYLNSNFETFPDPNPLPIDLETPVENPLYVPEVNPADLPAKKIKLDTNAESEIKAIIGAANTAQFREYIQKEPEKFIDSFVMYPSLLNLLIITKNKYFYDEVELFVNQKTDEAMKKRIAKHITNKTINQFINNGMGSNLVRLFKTFPYTRELLKPAQGKSAKGATYLHKVMTSCPADLIEYILPYVNIDAQDKNGNTALHLAAKKGNSKKWSELVIAGAKTDIKNLDGKTAADLLKPKKETLWTSSTTPLSSSATPQSSSALALRSSRSERSREKAGDPYSKRATNSEKEIIVKHMVDKVIAAAELAIKNPIEHKSIATKSTPIKAISLSAMTNAQRYNLQEKYNRIVKINNYIKNEGWYKDDKPDYYALLNTIKESGIDLDVALDKDGNTLFRSIIIHNIPIYMVRKLIAACPPFNINKATTLGETYLMTALLQRRPNMVDFLIRMGAAIASAIRLAHAFKENLLPSITPVQTVYHKLYEIALLCKGKLGADPIFSIFYIYEMFMLYVREQGWQYDIFATDYNYQPHLLDAPAIGKYVVNSFDMATAFRELLIMLDFKETELFNYHNVVSKPYKTSSELVIGKFTCFDGEYQEIILAKNECYEFKNHYVVKTKDGYFDPTFGCHFRNENDIIGNKIALNGYSNLLIDAFDESSTWQGFLPAFIEPIKALADWNLLIRKKSLLLANKNDQQMIHVNVVGQFVFTNYKIESVIKILALWEKAYAPNVNFTIFDVLDEMKGKEIYQNLNTYGFDCKKLEAIYLLTDDIDDERVNIIDKLQMPSLTEYPSINSSYALPATKNHRVTDKEPSKEAVIPIVNQYQLMTEGIQKAKPADPEPMLISKIG